MDNGGDLVVVMRAYRSHSEMPFYAGRLLELGVAVESLRAALRADQLDSTTVPVPLHRAVLAEERIAYFRHLAGQAARERRDALRAENDDRAIVDIARDLGVSRQAISKAISGKDMP